MRRSLTLLLTLSIPALAHAADVTLDGNTIVLPAPIVFETGSAKLASTEPLAPLVAFFAKREVITLVRIEGHVASGPDAQALSAARALAVARALVAQGVDCKRILPVAFGDTKPVADPKAPGAAARNTRIEAVNAAMRGRPIGGLPTDGGGQPAGDPCAK